MKPTPTQCLSMGIAFSLAGCANLDPGSMSKNSAVACFTGANWHGAPIAILYANADKGVAGTAGGQLNLTCGTAVVQITDEGRLTTVAKPKPGDLLDTPHGPALLLQKSPTN